MNQQNPTNLTGKKLIKLLKKTIKTVVIQKGINPSTRQGNKELELLVRKISKNSFNNLQQAKMVGEKLGETIVEFSQQKGKNYLDKGVIRQIVIQKKFSYSADFIPQELPFISQPNHQVIAKETSESQEVVKPLEDLQKNDKPTPQKTEELVSVEEIEPAQELEPTSQVTEEPSPKKDTGLMSLKDRLAEDIKSAMKAKDKIRLETVRSIKKALLEKEVAVRPTGQDSLTEEQEIELLAQQAKQRRESIEQYRQGGRDDLADKEAEELAIIETYLPKQLSDEEIGSILDEIITSVGATSPKEMGKVMGVAMKQLKGKADGKKIQAIVKSKLES
jgi:hypothetical protein